MPTYYDETTKTWFCKFYYTDYTGAKKQKKKRGFKLQREAKEWERTFLDKQTRNLNMSFESFVNLYTEDMAHRLKPKTLLTKDNIIKNHILPYFRDRNINDITAIDIRQWQNLLLNKNYSQAYLKKVNAQLNAIFNYATSYYDLKNNPCKKAGSIGSHKSKEMEIYTFQEFQQLMANIDDPIDFAIFNTFYYTGMRKGELFALQKKDIDLINGVIDINKSYQRIAKEDLITTTKTPKSVRKIEIPKHLVNILKTYIGSIYGVNDETYIFMPYYTRTRGRLKIAQDKAKLHEIRIHDFRHSHASLLIELGYSPLLVADRLGDNVETTLKVYSHLYPNKQSELVKKLDTLVNSTISVPKEE